MSTIGRRNGLLVTWMLAALIAPAGCSLEGVNGSNGDYPNGNNSYTSSAGTGGMGGMAGFVSQGGSGGWSNTTYPNGSGGGIQTGGEIEDLNPDDVCMGSRVDPEPVEITVETLVPYEVTVPKPIAIYLMLDHSGSMDDGTPTKWSIAVDAITTFVNDPASEFIEVALSFFPSPDPLCDGVSYATPVVPMGPLPANAPNITNAMAQPSQGLMTPIEPALRGMTSFCASYQTANPDIKCVGVLISDGAPSACNGDFNTLVGITQTAYDTPPHVTTFTVGMTGANFDLLNQISLWAGSDCTPNDPNTFACDVTPGSGMTLLQAFESIREFVTTLEERVEYKTEITTKISECDWGIPTVPEGETFNPDMVNVVFSEPGKEDVKFGRVKDAASCGNLQGAWYYDNPDTPTELIACPIGCEYIKAVEGGVIDIQFGCETIVLVE